MASAFADIIRSHLEDDVHALALKAHWYEPYNKLDLIQQIQARQKAKSKLPSWYGNFDLLFPPPLSIEQCSSELTAAYKASLVTGDSLADLTGGTGVDTAAFARRCQHVLFVEQQENLAATARHNFQTLGLNQVTVETGDIIQLLENLPLTDCIYVDPARRKEGHKVFRLEDCSPDLTVLVPRLLPRCHQILLKLSPLFDLTLLLRQWPEICAVHVVSVHHEVKELLVEIRPEAPRPPARIVCVNLENDRQQIVPCGCFGQPHSNIGYCEKMLRYLYEPHPTLMKSGMMDAYADRFHLLKLHPHSHLYTCDVLHADFFGRVFAIDQCFGFSSKELRKSLAGVEQANISVRNFPLSAEQLRKKLKLRDGGSLTLFATTLRHGEKVLVLGVKV